MRRNPLFNDPAFRQFFGGQYGLDEKRAAAFTRKVREPFGSGVIISPDGYILTV